MLLDARVLKKLTHTFIAIAVIRKGFKELDRTSKAVAAICKGFEEVETQIHSNCCYMQGF